MIGREAVSRQDSKAGIVRHFSRYPGKAGEKSSKLQMTVRQDINTL